MENNTSKQGADQAVQTAAAAVVAAPVEKEAASCFRKTVGEEATFMESAKDRFRQFKDARAVEHWSCIKSKVRSIFGEPKIVGVSAVDGGASKDDSKIST